MKCRYNQESRGISRWYLYSTPGTYGRWHAFSFILFLVPTLTGNGTDDKHIGPVDALSIDSPHAEWRLVSRKLHAWVRQTVPPPSRLHRLRLYRCCPFTTTYVTAFVVTASCMQMNASPFRCNNWCLGLKEQYACSERRAAKCQARCPSCCCNINLRRCTPYVKKQYGVRTPQIWDDNIV